MLQLGRRVRIDGNHLLIEVRPSGGLGHLGLEEGPRAHFDVHHVRIVETKEQILQLDERIALVLDLSVISVRNDDGVSPAVCSTTTYIAVNDFQTKGFSSKPRNAVPQRFLLAQGLVNDALRVFVARPPLPDSARAGWCEAVWVAR